MRTLALIKPDAVRRKHAGRIIIAIENQPRLEIIHMVSRHMNITQAEWFYGRQHRGQPYFDVLCQHMASGLTIALILEGEDAIAEWRRVMGPNDPLKREPWQIRARFQYPEDKPYENRVHGSDSRESYMHECVTWDLGMWL